MRVPHVSPLKGPSGSFEFKEKKMEGEEMLRSVARDRLTPRLFFICDSNLCYPVDATYAHFDARHRSQICTARLVERSSYQGSLRSLA